MKVDKVEPIEREIVVGVGQDAAFRIFVAEMTSWWPAAHHIGTAPIERIVVEPRVGGRWYTRHQDGSETSTGVVTAWEEPTRITLTWQIGADWQFHPDLVTTVDVHFRAEGPGLTRVVLRHAGLEAFGADAAAMRATFDSPEAWGSTLDAYATVADKAGASA